MSHTCNRPLSMSMLANVHKYYPVIRSMMHVLTRSGDIPRPRSSRTLLCVGLVFCSPVLGCIHTPRVLSDHTSTCLHYSLISRHKTYSMTKYLRNEADMDICKIVSQHTKLKLAKCFNKWHAFYVTNGATQLKYNATHKD